MRESGCLDQKGAHQGDREVSFAGSGWTEQHHVLGFGEEHAGAQVGDEVAVGAHLVVEIEVLNRFVSGKPGRLDP